MVKRLEKKLIVLFFAAFLFIRLVFALYSSGADILQFYGFSRTFIEKGFSFYLYADKPMDYWPYNWEYCYPPLWLYYIGLIYALLGEPNVVQRLNHYLRVSFDWVVLMKLPFIASDILVFTLFLKRFKRGVKASMIWFSSPAIIYISSIYGMFDSITALFILLALISYEESDVRKTALFSSLAFLLKQYSALILLFLLTHSLKNRGFAHSLRLLAYSALIILISSSPFILLSESPFESLNKLLNLTLMRRLEARYVESYYYNFNGFTSLLTWIHEEFKVETLQYFDYCLVMQPTLLLVILTLTIRGWLSDVWMGSYLTYVSFLTSTWRVNYQYLAPLIVLGLSCFAKLKSEGHLILVSTLIPSAWFFMYPVSFWFRLYYSDPNRLLISILDSLNLCVLNDLVYVCFSLFFTLYLLSLYAYSLIYLKSSP